MLVMIIILMMVIIIIPIVIPILILMMIVLMILCQCLPWRDFGRESLVANLCTTGEKADQIARGLHHSPHHLHHHSPRHLHHRSPRHHYHSPRHSHYSLCNLSLEEDFGISLLLSNQ